MEQDPNKSKAELIKLDDPERTRFAASIKSNLVIHDRAKKDGTVSYTVLADRILDDLNAVLADRTYTGGLVPRRKPDDPGDFPDRAIRVNVDYPAVTGRQMLPSYVPKYMIFDGRYRYDEDRAVVMDLVNNLDEAKRAAKEQGDAVVVDSADGRIVFDTQVKNEL